MSKTKTKQTKNNVETVENFRKYFNEEFETIEMSIRTAKDFQFLLDRIMNYLSDTWPENLYKNSLNYIKCYIQTSIDLHYKQKGEIKNEK